MAEYRLTHAAESDLESIWTYTVRQWGVEQADRYIDILTAAFAELADSPKSAPTCEHIHPGYRRRSVEHHIVYFRATDYGIAVVRVLHERMDAPRHLRCRGYLPYAKTRKRSWETDEIMLRRHILPVFAE